MKRSLVTVAPVQVLVFSLVLMLTMGPMAKQAMGQSALDMIRQEPHLAFGNMYPYHPMDTTCSEAPHGYKPFYISHFGRHGSRYDVAMDKDFEVIPVMTAHYEAGRLTPKGEQLYRDMMTIRKATEGNIGQLTAKGAAEHRGIAARMYGHYSQVFEGGGEVITYTTMVQRVIDSRDNFIASMMEKNPQLKFTLNYSDDGKWARQEVWGRSLTKKETEILNREETAIKIREELFKQLDGSRFAAEIFRNPDDAGNAPMLMFQILSATKTLACIDAEMPDMTRYFTPEELYHMWCRYNNEWYAHHGITPDNRGIRADVKGRLIAEAIIKDADRAIASKGRTAATLRFGHDGDLNPLLSFLDIEGTNCTDLYQLAEQARDFEIVRTGANLQLIFYRNEKGDVLVKALRNEMETHIAGLTPVHGLYYSWSDVRKYWKTRRVKNL